MESTAGRELVIQSSLEEINAVEAFLEELNAIHQFKDDVFGNIMIATTEAVTNGIIHGNKNNPNLKVFIRSQLLKPYLLSITVQDQGPGFEPDSIKDPTAPENLLSEDGRGVFIIRHLTDSCEWRGNVLEMRFNI
jgi:serine/threonine-protein kinase RsbW